MNQKDISSYLLDRIERTNNVYRQWKNGILEDVRNRIVRFPTNYKLISVYTFIQDVSNNIFPTYAKHFEFEGNRTGKNIQKLIEDYIKTLPVATICILIEIPLNEIKDLITNQKSNGSLIIEIEEFKHSVKTITYSVEDDGAPVFYVSDVSDDLDDLFPFIGIFKHQIAIN